jgi:hypothetical protein
MACCTQVYAKDVYVNASMAQAIEHTCKSYSRDQRSQCRTCWKKHWPDALSCSRTCVRARDEDSKSQCFEMCRVLHESGIAGCVK